MLIFLYLLHKLFDPDLIWYEIHLCIAKLPSSISQFFPLHLHLLLFSLALSLLLSTHSHPIPIIHSSYLLSSTFISLHFLSFPYLSLPFLTFPFLYLPLSCTYQKTGGSPWEVPFAQLVGENSYETLGKFYTGYGIKIVNSSCLRAFTNNVSAFVSWWKFLT